MTPAPVILSLCGTCAGSDRSALCQALAAAPVPVSLRTVPCMNACGRPVAMALQGEGRATCLFGGIDPVADAGDIVATVGAYAAAPGGWILDALACGRLRLCLIGRVPAFASATAGDRDVRGGPE